MFGLRVLAILPDGGLQDHGVSSELLRLADSIHIHLKSGRYHPLSDR